ncbi:hypothetical protein F7725_025943 [Dissostichus mawsoni]|uniref:Uncharacterized protein n=1 Tax=Dissostichus mawsoni TaxID=36200 RepID=A0A7J5X754_DISMA|nr:hypothetical protein F7725_025943 [Dissostichus mawsoni]
MMSSVQINHSEHNDVIGADQTIQNIMMSSDPGSESARNIFLQRERTHFQQNYTQISNQEDFYQKIQFERGNNAALQQELEQLRGPCHT